MNKKHKFFVLKVLSDKELKEVEEFTFKDIKKLLREGKKETYIIVNCNSICPSIYFK